MTIDEITRTEDGHRNSSPKMWPVLAIGSAVVLGTATHIINQGVQNYELNEITQTVKNNTLFEASAPIVLTLEQKYFVSDLSGDGEADAVYVTVNEDESWRMYHRRDVYRKGDPGFETILNAAKLAYGSQEEGK